MVNRYARIKREALAKHLDAWIARYPVLAPVLRDGIRRFEPLTDGTQAEPGPWLTKIPLKELFLPQTECLYRYRCDRDGGLDIEAPENAPSTRIVFGVRPCDARALTLLDQVFRDTDTPDPFYCARRDHTILVGIACAEPRSVCFCTSVGSGPFAEENLDLLMAEVGDDLFVKSLSTQGEALLTDLPAAPSDEIEAGFAKARRQAEASMAPRVPMAELRTALDTDFDAAVWDRLHESCIGCGVCAFLCPTCHCFDLSHETAGSSAPGDAGRCVRSWDTCMFSLFTRQASGVNPRPSGKERMRQRLMHKFRYFVDNHGLAACVGCGRCIVNCPANGDIREAIVRLQQATTAADPIDGGR